MTRQEMIDLYLKMRESGRLEELKNNPDLPMTPEEDELPLYYEEFHDEIALRIEPDYTGCNWDITLKEAQEIMKELKESGEFERFLRKYQWEMTPRELNLFAFDDGYNMYDPFSGTIIYLSGENCEYSEPFTEEKLKALGMWPGMKTKSFSEMTNEEKRIMGYDNI